MSEFKQDFAQALLALGYENPKQAPLNAVYQAVSKAAMAQVQENWGHPVAGKTACYFSAEFLIGRMVYSNLYNMGLLVQMKETFAAYGLDFAMLEEVEDAALGNGGLGRLAACFLDSAATEGLRLDGYGIRYKYGLFQQYFEDGFQKELPDDWQRFGDPWSVRREEEKVLVNFGGQSVWAVPYDMPVIGYGAKTVNNLRLWQAEPVHAFDFDLFNQQKYDASYKEKNDAEAIHSLLYPNDDTEEGKKLRLKQQYFFSSASLQSVLQKFKAKFGTDWQQLPNQFAIQLNDTHPTVAIPELLRILMEQELLSFEEAFAVVQKTFAYTNHTIMAEALEKWSVALFTVVLPHVYPYVVMLENHLQRTLAGKGLSAKEREQYAILEGGRIHMARMAIFATHSTNGVAALHTEILKQDALKEWYSLFPERFNNKTNGITQRRWLALCNPELAAFITKRIGDGWITNLDELEKLLPYAEDDGALAEFEGIKKLKKEQLAGYIQQMEGVALNPNAIFDIQIKRLHEYKRQLLNAFSILHLYFELKEGRLTDMEPMAFLFGAKAAPGYFRAKGIIKFINEIAKLVNNDPASKDKLQVVFVQNYNVSYAERLIPAADISEQISTAGTEASGTGNMKLMLNGAVTLGTYDGANVEIVQQAGMENNYIFGARVEEIRQLAAEGYNPAAIYKKNETVRRVVDALIDGTLDDGGTGMFKELYDALLVGASWHAPDHYFLLQDLPSYIEAKLRANQEYKNRREFSRKCLLNIAKAGKFSSDRTIREYAKDIWGLQAK